MNDKLEYRPVNINFTVAHDGTLMPESFGSFETSDEAMKYVGKHLTNINQGITVNRHMDGYEKKLMREEYQDILENLLPSLQKQQRDRDAELVEAKKKAKEADDLVNAHMIKVEMLAKEVKQGVKTINLDDLHTVRIPYGSKYYYYTYMDKEFKLCAIKDIPNHEKTEIWSHTQANEEFINKEYGGIDIENNLKAENNAPVFEESPISGTGNMPEEIVDEDSGEVISDPFAKIESEFNDDVAPEDQKAENVDMGIQDDTEITDVDFENNVID